MVMVFFLLLACLLSGTYVEGGAAVQSASHPCPVHVLHTFYFMRFNDFYVYFGFWVDVDVICGGGDAGLARRKQIRNPSKSCEFFAETNYENWSNF